MIVQKIQFVCKFFVCLCWILRCMQGDHPLEVSQFSQLEPVPVLPLCNNLCSKTLWWAPPPSKYGWRRNRGSCQASDSTFSPQDHLFYIFSNRTRCVHQKAVRGGWVEWAWRLFSERGQFLSSPCLWVASFLSFHSSQFHTSTFVWIPQFLSSAAYRWGFQRVMCDRRKPHPTMPLPCHFLFVFACLCFVFVFVFVFVCLCVCVLVFFVFVYWFICVFVYLYLYFCDRRKPHPTMPSSPMPLPQVSGGTVAIRFPNPLPVKPSRDRVWWGSRWSPN